MVSLVFTANNTGERRMRGETEEESFLAGDEMWGNNDPHSIVRLPIIQ